MPQNGVYAMIREIAGIALVTSEEYVRRRLRNRREIGRLRNVLFTAYIALCGNKPAGNDFPVKFLNRNDTHGYVYRNFLVRTGKSRFCQEELKNGKDIE